MSKFDEIVRRVTDLALCACVVALSVIAATYAVGMVTSFIRAVNP